MKKAVSILLAALLLLANLTGCGGGDTSPKQSAGQSNETSNTADKASDEAELAKLKELYDGKWINQDPYDDPFEMEVIGLTSVKITHENSDALICDLFYSADDLTHISVSLSGMSLGNYSIDTQTGILTYKPQGNEALTYEKQ